MEGRVLAGRYRLLSKIGEGGMGSVWRAVHLTLGTPLAIKLIDPSIAQSAEALSRFKREAQSAAELRSVHVVQIIDYGVDDDTPFIAMEMLDGESLAARLERMGHLSPQDTATILSQVARALVRAHGTGIIHRDLKPENIFLVPEGDEEIAKVLDFGIAKKLDALSSSSGVRTGTGAMLGTPYYMSPEQALGQTAIDHRTDIWSLGIIAYQCITGVRPFDRDTLGALLMAICNDPLPAPSSIAEVPIGFDAWFARAAARNPAERFASAADATAELRKICEATSGRRASSPSIASDATVASTHRASPVAEPRLVEMAHTAAPSSVTIAGLNRVRVPRAAMVAVGVAIAAVGLAITGGTLLQSRTMATNSTGSALSTNAPLSTELQPASPLIPTTNATPFATGVDRAPLDTSAAKRDPSDQPSIDGRPRQTPMTNPNPVSQGPASANHVDATALPRAAKPVAARTPTAAASASAALAQPSIATGKATPHRNYDRSVGF